MGGKVVPIRIAENAIMIHHPIVRLAEEKRRWSKGFDLFPGDRKDGMNMDDVLAGLKSIGYEVFPSAVRRAVQRMQDDGYLEGSLSDGTLRITADGLEMLQGAERLRKGLEELQREGPKLPDDPTSA